MSIREFFNRGEEFRQKFSQSASQSDLETAISSYTAASALVARLSLFSENETVEDVVTSELRYLLIDHYLGKLRAQVNTLSRRLGTIETAVQNHTTFLTACVNYDLVSAEDKSSVDLILRGESADKVTRNTDVRTLKIERYRREKSLHANLQKSMANASTDEESGRKLVLTVITLAVMSSIQELDSLNMELSILKHKAQTSTKSNDSQDRLLRPRSSDDNATWRVDTEQPLLDNQGKVLKPFIITGKRETMNKGVFGPDHSLPTMSIDEYLELEKARGGILDPSTASPDKKQLPEDDDNDEKTLEAARKKAIDWDRFTEENPKGIGNTMMNRG